METSSQYLKQLSNRSIPKQSDSDSNRYQQAAIRFQLNHQKSQQQKKVDNILEKANESSILVPRPGEFLVVSSRANSKNKLQSPGKREDKTNKQNSYAIPPPLFSARRSVTRLQETPVKAEKMMKKSASANTIQSVPNTKPELTLQEMQKELLKDSNLHTNLTTNIREIMQQQNPQLLTQSTRLLSSQKKRQMPKETLQILKRVQSNASIPTHQSDRITKMISLKPSASVNVLPTATVVPIQRPSSALLLNDADDQTKHQLSQKFDLKGARFRNQQQHKSHSYRPQVAKSQRTFISEAQKTSIPSIVRFQRELIKEKRTISPFMMNEEREFIPTPSLPQLSTLQTDRSQRSTSKLLNFQHEIKGKQQDLQASEAEKKQFFPLEAYDPLFGQEDLESLVDKYKDEATGVTLGQSRWQVKQNSTELRPCEIVRYLPLESLFLIKWLQNGKMKKVVRFNLVFDKEDRNQLEWRYKEAEELRRVGQLMQRYVLLCQDTDLSQKAKLSSQQNTKQANPQCSDNTKTRISYLVSSFDSFNLNVKERTFKDPLQVFQRSAAQRYDIQFFRRWEWVKQSSSTEMVQRICETMLNRKLNFNLLSELFVELDLAYVQVHKQILFDCKLPYSDGRFDEIAEVLPINKFQPLQERFLTEQNIIVIPSRSSQFEHLVQHMSNRLHFAHAARLKILRLSNHHNQILENADIFHMNYTAPMSIEKLIEVNKRASSSVIKLFKNQTFDMQYEIQKLITQAVQENTEINTRLKSEMTYNQHEYVNTPLPQNFIEETRELQKVLQMRYEQAQRQNFIQSTNRFIGKLNTILANLYDSSGKDLSVQDLADEDVLQLSRDSILETRSTKGGNFVLQSRLRFNEGSIKVEPPEERWLDAFMQILESFQASSDNMPCFNAEESILGPVYADLKTHIFLPNETFRSEQSSIIRSQLQQILKVLTALVQASSKFQGLLNTDLSEFKKYHKKNDFPVDFYKQLLDKGIEMKEAAEKLFFEPILKLGPFHVDCQKLKGLVLKKIVDLDNVMCDCIVRKIAKNNKQIEDEVEGVLAIIKHQTVYRDIEHVTETKQYIQNLPNKMLEIRALIKDAMSKMTLLEKYQRSLSQEEMANTWFSISKPLSIFEAQGDCMELLEIFADRFAIDLNVMRATLADEVRSIEAEFETVIRYESLQLYERAVNKCDQIYDRLDSAIATSQVVNRREKLYNQHPSDYSKIHELKRSFLPLNSLWNFARDYFYKINLWMNGPLSDIERDKMPNEITIACRGLLKLAKQDLRQIAGMSINIANDLRNLYLELKPYLPIVQSLKNPDLQTRHWESINKTREGTIIDPDLHQSISDLLKIKVLEIMEDIATVSDIASKEKQLEVQLAKMRQEWHSVKFELHEYAATVTLGGVQHIWDMLDEQIQKTMVIAGSPYVKYLIQDVLFWKQQLVKMQEILEEWSKVQRGWLYLFPIFSSQDIQEQLEDVYQMFQSVDKMWRVIMLSTQNNPSVVEACNQLKLLENLTQCNSTMERVQKSLNQYLHDKRLLFPRFFFLSNDDLLQILSQTKDPTRVQDHLNKCFEGIYRLKFSGEGNQIQVEGMYSQLDEFVSFNQPVRPFFKKKREFEVKPVEEWLLEVEKQMRESLRREMKEASESFVSLPNTSAL